MLDRYRRKELSSTHFDELFYSGLLTCEAAAIGQAISLVRQQFLLLETALNTVLTQLTSFSPFKLIYPVRWFYKERKLLSQCKSIHGSESKGLGEKEVCAAYNLELPQIAFLSLCFPGTGLTLRYKTLLRKPEWEKSGNNCLRNVLWIKLPTLIRSSLLVILPDTKCDKVP